MIQTSHSPVCVKILLIEQRALLRDSFVQRFGSEQDLDVEAVPKLDDLGALTDSHDVDLVVVSVTEPDHGNTLRETLKVIGRLRPGVPCVVLSGEDDTYHVVEAFEAGAKGYVTMSMPFVVVLAALRLVAAGGTFAPAGCLTARRPDATPAVNEQPAALFTERQLAVVDALSKGMANKTIAYELNLRESTVKVHVRKIMRKLHATNRTQAAFLASSLKNGAWVGALQAKG
jgi:DNA-binding NarL/FixJ family response regulator